MESICWATTESTSMLMRLNSSKQPQAPDWERGEGERREKKCHCHNIFWFDVYVHEGWGHGRQHPPPCTTYLQYNLLHEESHEDKFCHVLKVHIVLDSHACIRTCVPEQVH